MSLINRNLRNYLIALATLVICASVYRAGAEYLLTLPEVAEVTPRPPTQTDSATEGLADLFPVDAWQRGDCKRLLTSSGTLLFQRWQQISPDRWELEPLTIVIGRGLADERTESPIIMHAEEGAELQFAESLDMMGGTAPPIKMGRMIGDVSIKRANVTKRSEALDVQTRNVRIDNQKVWTTERITMQVAGADLRGIDLTIYLAASANSAAKAETPSTILDRMDLVYLEELRIPLDQPQTIPLRPRRIGTASIGTAAVVGEQTQSGDVSIKCRNGLSYDFALDRLSLRDSISMVRALHGQVLDAFYCDTLDLSLRDPADLSVQRQSPLDWIDRVHATGRPAVINLASYDFRLDADEIDFDAVGGLLLAEGQQGIRIRRGPIDATLARLAYQYDPETPQQLGAIDVRGDGEVTVDQPGMMLRYLSWAEGFRLQPIGPATLDALQEKRVQSKLQLRIDGDIQAKLADGGTAHAGSIEGLLRPRYVDQPVASAPATTTFGSSNPPSQSVERKMTLVPEVLHAMDAVSIDTNQIAAQTDRMSLFFEEAADYGKAITPQANADAIRPQSGSVVSQPGAVTSQPGLATTGEASNNPGALAGFVNQPGPQAGLHSPVATPRPKLSGNSVSAKLLITSAGIQPKDVSIEGNVLVEHQVNVGQSLLPIKMAGQTMRLLRSDVAQSSGQDYLQLGSGPQSPARLTMGDGFFVGPTIKVWPSDNVLQVAGAGELRVPSELLKKDEPSLDVSPSDETSPIGITNVDWTSAPYCRWGESMQFDGQTALLTGGVQIDAELTSGASPWITKMNGDEMQIILATPIAIADQKSMAAAQLAEIRLVQSESQPVVVRAEQRTADQDIESIHLITANRLTFSPGGGGKLSGAGPGWYRGWMMMDQKQTMLSPQAATPASHLGGQVLQGVHLTFREALHGDLKNETLAFTGGVRTGIRKLQSWDEVVDVAQMERLAVGEMTMDCQQLKFGIIPGIPEDVRQIPGMPTPWEMTAEGGVVVRTNTQTRGLIEGTAARASYDSKKSWLNVEGSPGHSAFVRQTWPDGRAGFQTHSPRMLLNLKTYEFQTIMQDAQINNIGLPGK